MGNCFDRQQSETSADPQEDTQSAKPASTASRKPKPMIFALMRNGHEVIRGNMIEIEDFLSKGDMEGAFKSYHELHKWMTMHMYMEEGNPDAPKPVGFFSTLDERFEGIAKENGLRDDHTELESVESSLIEAGKEGNIEKFKKQFNVYKEKNEAHLKKEEGVMMPKVQAMVKSGVNMKELMIQNILAAIVDSPDFKFFVQHANYILDKYPGGMPRARVFDHALWAVATPEQWKEWKGWIEESVPKERFEEVMGAIGE